MSRKQVKHKFFRLHLEAQKANPAPPVGPTIGQHGLNIMDFCKKFNQASECYPPGTPVAVNVTIIGERNFSLKVGQPITSYLINQLAETNTDGQRVIKSSNVTKIAEQKMSDLTSNTLEAAERTVLGCARSMNIKLID